MAEIPDRAAAWEAEGRRLAAAVDGVSAALVTGHDAPAVAHLALGIAAEQAGRRRVAVADLAGSGPLTRLVSDQVTDEDPHGLADVFLYGMSMNRVARQLDAEGRLFVVPTGTEPLPTEHYAHDRWRRVRDGFHDVGALLLVVAPTDSPELPRLAAQLDGTVAADHGDAAQAMPNLLATARTPDAALPMAGVPRVRSTTKTALTPAPEPKRRIHPALLAVAGLLLVAALVWAARLVGGDAFGGRTAATPDETTRTAPGTAALATSDSTALAAAPAPTDSAATADSAARVVVPPVANPEDSSRAAAYAIELLMAPTEDAARRLFRTRSPQLLAATLTPVTGPDGSTTGYRVSAGAYEGQADARAILAVARRDGMVRAGGGTLTRLPYAVQLESGVPLDSLRTVLNRFAALGVAAYAMRQGTADSHNVYAGAFAEPREARALLAELQAAAIPAALVVRTGRPI